MHTSPFASPASQSSGLSPLLRRPLSLLGALATGSTVLLSQPAWACASCGCSINSDWSAQGLGSSQGWSLDMRYDEINQNKLWSGNRAISAATAANTTNPKTQQAAEVEQFTKNNYLTATLDYSNGRDWGLGLAVPYIDRTHSTLGVGSDGTTFDAANGAYRSSGSGIGDVKLVGRYFGLLSGRNLGLQLGLKLPTGAKDQVAQDGQTQVDPGLQRGTGTTDLIVGVYYFDALTPLWGYFSQLSYQSALDHASVDGGTYRPGNSVNASVGMRYKGFANWVPTAQINARFVQTDSGAVADTYSTGGKLVYLTLGALVPVNTHMTPYVNLQLPLYQDVNGIQLTPRYILSVGAKYAF